MENTLERIYHGDAFADIRRGVYLIRGENVVLLGEVVSPSAAHTALDRLRPCSRQDLDREDEIPLRPVPLEEIGYAHQEESDKRKQNEQAKAQILYDEKGFCKEGGEGDGY